MGTNADLIKEIVIMNMTEENCVSIPFFVVFFFILTSIQARRSERYLG